jgi:hypothetical protein
VLENDDNRASLLDPLGDPPGGKYRAQWNDDFHHAWHVLLTDETTRLLPRLAREPRADHRAYPGVRLRLSGRSLGTSRAGAPGEPSAALPPTAFVNFLQNHDQIGNRALGDRLDQQADDTASSGHGGSRCSHRCRRCCSWARNGDRPGHSRSSVTFTGDLAEAVRKDAGQNSRRPMPNFGATGFPIRCKRNVPSAVLDWDARETPRGRAWTSPARCCRHAPRKSFHGLRAAFAFCRSGERDILNASLAAGGERLQFARQLHRRK